VQRNQDHTGRRDADQAEEPSDHSAIIPGAPHYAKSSAHCRAFRLWRLWPFGP
jgi:hypothetical protein